MSPGKACAISNTFVASRGTRKTNKSSIVSTAPALRRIIIPPRIETPPQMNATMKKLRGSPRRR